MSGELPSEHSTPLVKEDGADALSEAVGTSERVQVIVEECAEELSSVNQELQDNLAAQPSLAGAVEKNTEVESKIQVASSELTQLNDALKAEVDERRALEAQLAEVTAQAEHAQQVALHDGLTGLPNRALFADRLDHGLAQAKRHGWLLAVMFVDLNGFKAINDRHGHRAGDAVLLTVATRLKQHTRADDTVGRQGGDEFLYLLLEVKREEDIALIAQKLASLISQPCKVEGREGPTMLRVGASIGISLYPRDGATAEQLIAQADAAMYSAKRSGLTHAFSSASSATDALANDAAKQGAS